MNSLRNSVQLIGHLGSHPQVKKLNSGTTLASVNIATRDSYKNAQGEFVDQTTWHRLVGWGKLAERMEKVLTKGREIAVRGQLVNRSYDDKNGIKRYVTEIRINDFELLGKKPTTVGDFDVAAEKEAKVPF